MVAFVVSIYSGVTSFTFNVDSPLEQELFTVGMVKKLIKAKQQLPSEMKCVLWDEAGYKLTNGVVLVKEFPAGATLDMTFKGYSRSDSKELFYPGDTLVTCRNKTVLYSPLQPFGFIRENISGDELYGQSKHQLTVFPNDTAVPYDCSYGLNYLKQHVHAYVSDDFEEEEGRRVWFWMSNGQIESWPLLENMFTKRALEKAEKEYKVELLNVRKLYKDKMKQALKMKKDEEDEFQADGPTFFFEDISTSSTSQKEILTASSGESVELEEC